MFPHSGVVRSAQPPTEEDRIRRLLKEEFDLQKEELEKRFTKMMAEMVEEVEGRLVGLTPSRETVEFVRENVEERLTREPPATQAVETAFRIGLDIEGDAAVLPLPATLFILERIPGFFRRKDVWYQLSTANRRKYFPTRRHDSIGDLMAEMVNAGATTVPALVSLGVAREFVDMAMRLDGFPEKSGPMSGRTVGLIR